MKKHLLLLSLLLSSFSSYSSEVYKVVVCDNLSDDYPEDSLVLDFYDNTALYNGNDTDDLVPCNQLENGITQCSDGHWTILVPMGGENTTVFEGRDLKRSISFDCKH